MNEPRDRNRKKRPFPQTRSGGGGAARRPRPAAKRSTPLRLRRLDRNRFALLVPHCALEREEDLDEVRKMMLAGEHEIARDELLYLVADCRAFLAAHNLLGELALEDEDIPLARGHYGFAYEIGLESLGAGFTGQLPANREYNGEFFLAGRGLARCLIARGQRSEGRDVLEFLAKLDPRERDVRALLEELNEQERTGTIPALPVVDDAGDDDEETDED